MCRKIEVPWPARPDSGDQPPAERPSVAPIGSAPSPPFGYRDFRVLWFGAFTSTVGNWMQQVAQAWLVFELTNSSFFLGLDDFLGQLPILLFTLIGGVVADRHDRRHVLLGSQYIQMATAFIAGGARLPGARARASTSCCSRSSPGSDRPSADRPISR